MGMIRMSLSDTFQQWKPRCRPLGRPIVIQIVLVSHRWSIEIGVRTVVNVTVQRGDTIPVPSILQCRVLTPGIRSDRRSGQQNYTENLDTET